MVSAFLKMLLIGYGSLGTILFFLSRGRPRLAAASRLPIGKLWSSASISPKNLQITHSRNAIAAFDRVVAPDRALLGVGSLEVPPRSGWDKKDVPTIDHDEVALAERLQNSALAHVADSTSDAYVGPWNAFVI